jgi:5-methylcytosine-specific restriction protein A
MSERLFRRPESYEAENVTRKMLPGFLRDRGFTVKSDRHERQGQTIVATSPEGECLTMRVRLCWRRETDSRDSERVRTYSAAQLLAKIKDDDWVGTLQAKVRREKARGVTHLLLVQRDDKDIKYAALVPLSELVQIWTDQRDISKRLIDEGRLGRRKKNHAMNGSSPTIWLEDDRGGKEVAAALWNHRGVRNLAELPVSTTLRPEEAQGTTSGNVAGYVPQEGDRRAVIQRQIKERRGQQPFRDALRRRYGDRCLVTGCKLLDVLEAAHIRPYRGESDNHIENGLLLRADVHTLFDLNLLGIEPDQLRIRLNPAALSDPCYAALEGKTLICTPHCRPSVDALRVRYQEFTDRLGSAPTSTT